MNPLKTGAFLAQKRKERQWTQEQLAEKTGVSSKTISKWECGRSMPDSSVMEALCAALGISVNELLCGETVREDQQQLEAQKNALQALRAVERLEREKQVLAGILLLVMGIALLAFSATLDGGSALRDFFSGCLLGISLAVMLAGVFVSVRQLAARGK